MRTYLACIAFVQQLLLAVSVVLLATLPSALILLPAWFTDDRMHVLYAIAHVTLFFVMLVRPLADIFRSIQWIRPLVILRKGFGVLSASIIVSFMLAKLQADPEGYIHSFATFAYWSPYSLALFAHLADLAAVILLATSNNLSKRVLGRYWKRIQRLSYVYFYASGIYVFFVVGDQIVLYYLIIITFVTVVAWLRNHALLRLRARQLAT